MRRLIAIAIACVFVAVPAMADLTTQIEVTRGPGSGNGGAFLATIIEGTISYANVNLVKGDSFLTFCLENDEYLSFDRSYWVKIDTVAREGGSGGPSPDPLDPVTAALYQQWRAAGDLTADQANKYQLAIWKVEDEARRVGTQWMNGNLLDPKPLDSAYQAYSEATIQALIDGVGSPSDIGVVRVMTLWEDKGGTLNAQDLLVAPVPAAALLGVFGLCVAGLKLRRLA